MVTQQAVLDLLDDLRADLGLDVWLISHDLPLVASRCDDLAVMHAGRIVETGPTAEVLSRPRHPHTRELLAAFDRLGAPSDPQPAAVGEGHVGAGGQAGDGGADPGGGVR